MMSRNGDPSDWNTLEGTLRELPTQTQLQMYRKTKKLLLAKTFQNEARKKN